MMTRVPAKRVVVIRSSGHHPGQAARLSASPTDTNKPALLQRRTQVKRGIRSAGLVLGTVGMTLLPAAALWAAGASFSYKEVARLDTKAPGGGMLVHDFELGRV